MSIRPSPSDPRSNDHDSWIEDRVPDRSLFFPNPAHDRLLELVRHLAENTEEAALLIGPHGAGKTTLIYRLQGEVPDHWLLCRLDANPMLHPDQLLHGLAHSIAAPFDESGLTDDLHTSFGALRLQGRLPVVVIDDADQLPVSSLMAVLHLHELSVEGLPPFALILLAEPTIDTTLASQQLHAMGTARFQRLELPLLAPEQIGNYIEHFLRVEGVTEDVHLPPEWLQTIHQQAGGVPGKINELVVRALREGGTGRHSGKSLGRWLRRQLPRALAVTASAILLVLGLLLFQAPAERTAPRRASPAGREQGWVMHPLVLPTPTAPSSDLSTDSPQPAEVPPAPLVLRPKLPAASLSAVSLAAQEVQYTASSRGEVTSSSAQGQAPAKIQGLKSPKPPKDGPDTPKGPASENTPAPHAPAPVQVARAGSESAGEPRHQSRPSTTTDTTPRLSSEHTFKRTSWVLRQPGDAYSLQLVAVSDEAAVQRYITRAGIADQAFYVESQRKGRPWFSVLYGLYPNRAAAIAALQRLPPALRQAGAWPRPLRAIQAEIGRSRGR